MAGSQEEQRQRAHDAEAPSASPAVSERAAAEPSGTRPDTMEAELDDVIARLDVSRGKLPKVAIRDARRLRLNIIPRLVELIERGTEAARKGERVDSNGAFFALYLLAEFQAKEALPAILKAMYVQDDGDLFGDAITQDFNRMLAVLAVDARDTVKKLIDDHEAYLYARWEAANTYALWVRDGLMTREVAVETLRLHLIKALHDKDIDIIGPLVCCLGDLGAVEAENEIREAFQRDLVDLWLVDQGFIESQLADSEGTFREEQARCPPSGIADTIEELSQWHGFQEQKSPNPSLARAAAPVKPVSSPTKSYHQAEPLANASGAVRPQEPHLGRNDPCPCGSGKKYKKCCGFK